MTAAETRLAHRRNPGPLIVTTIYCWQLSMYVIGEPLWEVEHLDGANLSSGGFVVRAQHCATLARLCSREARLAGDQELFWSGSFGC